LKAEVAITAQTKSHQNELKSLHHFIFVFLRELHAFAVESGSAQGAGGGGGPEFLGMVPQVLQ